MDYYEYGHYLVNETRRNIAGEKEDLLDSLNELADRLPAKAFGNVLSSVYYGSDGILKVKEIEAIAARVHIEWSSITCGVQVPVVCLQCNGEEIINVSSRTQYATIQAHGHKFVCTACATKAQAVHDTQWKAKRALEQERQNARLQWLRTIPYSEYLQTDEWKDTRRRAFKRADYKCELCHSSGELHVHHKTYENRGNEYYKDLIVLCANCHAKFHDKLPKRPQ